MRLVYASQSYLPSTRANTVQVLHMCDAFAGLGHDVTLLGKQSAGEAATIDDDFGLAHKFGLIRLPRPKRRGGGLVYEVALCASIIRRRRRTDLLYARDEFGPVVAGLLGIPCIYEAHSVPVGVNMVLLRWAVRRRSFVRVIAITASLAEDLEHAGVQLSTSARVAADAARDPGPYVPPPRGGPFRVGYAGSFAKGKGADWLVDIAAELPEVEFLVIGGLPEQVGRVAAGAPTNVRLLGHVAHSSVPDLLRTCHLLALPYRDRVFGATETAEITAVMSPLKLFEYLAVGRPIVASDLPVLKEALPPGDGVVYRSPNDRSGWIEAIRDLDRRRDLVDAFGEHNRRRFEQGHTWANRAEYVLADTP